MKGKRRETEESNLPCNSAADMIRLVLSVVHSKSSCRLSKAVRVSGKREREREMINSLIRLASLQQPLTRSNRLLNSFSTLQETLKTATSRINALDPTENVVQLVRTTSSPASRRQTQTHLRRRWRSRKDLFTHCLLSEAVPNCKFSPSSLSFKRSSLATDKLSCEIGLRANCI